jgi:hypothetical protein
MAERIKSYQFSRRFRKEYLSLPKEVQKTFDEKLKLFLQDMSHPSLRVKRIQGTKDRWEGSVTKKIPIHLSVLGQNDPFPRNRNTRYLRP